MDRRCKALFLLLTLIASHAQVVIPGAIMRTIATAGGGPDLVFVNEVEMASIATTDPQTSPSIAVQVGDFILVYAVAENSDMGFGAVISNSGTAQTWNLGPNPGAASKTEIATYYATATAAESITVTVNPTSSGSKWWLGVAVFRNSTGIGNTANTTTGGSQPSLAITTAANNSAVFCIVGDWNAIDGNVGGAAGRTWRTINSIIPSSGNSLERTYIRDSAAMTVYAGYWNDVGTAGAKTAGLTAPSGQDSTIVAIEIKD